jgi:hypothetical protein
MDTLKLDGREFTGITQSLTANQDGYVQAHLARSGAKDVLLDIDETRTDRAKAEELLTRLQLTGKTHNVLAGCLTEVGKKWTVAEADRNAIAFSEITDNDEKVAMREAIVGFVIGFFSLGAGSSTTSPRSSSPTAKASRTKSAGR